MSDHAEAVRNFYRRQGAEAERERIIKLIEENMDHWDGWFDVKALIKGEQK